MRLSNVLALVLVSLAAVPVCGQPAANAATAAVGVPGPAYDTSAAANQRFLADYAVRPNVKKLPDGLMYRVLKVGRRSAASRRTPTWRRSITSAH